MQGSAVRLTCTAADHKPIFQHAGPHMAHVAPAPVPRPSREGTPDPMHPGMRPRAQQPTGSSG
jgi:hypothetical protein